MKKPVVTAGVHNYTAPEEYIPPQDPAVREHLAWFMGLKLGFMMHWAPGSQLGTFESWPLSDGDGAWSQKDLTWADKETCKRQYREANRTFNPVKFDPAGWAELAKECGFQYLLFTTKHHDGFCMFDTHTTDYKITAPDCPFHTHPDADVVGALWREFRARGMGICAYFSKPDWHSPDYWAPQFGPAPTRNVNYDPAEHPELWERFVSYTHDQLRELCTRYGQVDVLWLDGGWVRPDNLGQDIRLEQIVRELRQSQPQLIVSDRTCGGTMENFITPEKTVPDAAPGVPWETCVPVGQHFSFHYCDHFKSGRELVLLLLDVVSKGGNLALNITPQPDGALPAQAVRSLRDLGAWLQIYGSGIYGTEACAPWVQDGTYFTRRGRERFVFRACADAFALPDSLDVPVDGWVEEAVSLRTGRPLFFRQSDPDRVRLDLSALPRAGSFYAEGFRLLLRQDAQ